MAKRALVLAGGGARGAYQVGMLEELVINRGIDFQIIRGVSVGALNAAFLAQASIKGDSLGNLKKKVEKLLNLWTDEIKGNHSVYAGIGGVLGLAAVAAGGDSIFSLEPLKHLILDHLSLSALRKSGRDFAVGTVSLVSGHYEEWTPKDGYFLERLLASASIPVIFPYVDLKRVRDVLVDGGVRNITPLSSAFDAAPDEIYILLASRLIREGLGLPESAVQEHDYQRWDDNWLGTKVSGYDVLKRSMEILIDEIHLDDIRGALRWNEIAEGIRAVEKASRGGGLPGDIARAVRDLAQTLKKVNKRTVPLFVIAPREWFGDNNSSTDFYPSLIRKAIDHGREVAAHPDLWVWPPGV
jgi:NTE family protein